MLEARQRVRDQCRVVALHVAHGVAQLEGGQLVLDHGLAAPARVGAQQVGLAIAIGVEQAGELGVGQLADVRDLVLVGGALVDHVTLRSAGGEHALARELGVAARRLVELGVVRVPVVGDEGGIALGHRDVGQRVVHLAEGLHVVAELLQGLHHQQGLKVLFDQRTFQRQHAHAFAG